MMRTMVKLLDSASYFLLSFRGPAMKILARLPPAFFESMSEKRALYLFRNASRSVPAYKNFLRAHQIDPGQVRTIDDLNALVPQTTKENYVRSYPLSERCLKGRLPSHGYLDESSGTSGLSTNWIRSADEGQPYFPLMKMIMKYLYGVCEDHNYILLNGFTIGAWAGGQRFSQTIGPLGVIKNIGTDADKILGTMKDVGTQPHYLISGYPPFLKDLIDQGQKTKWFDWKDYNVHIITGGEGFLEEWRDYLASHLREGAKIFSVYGAIDLETAIAMENPLCVAIKKLLTRNQELRRALLASDRLPCFLGQYSPMYFYIRETMPPEGIRELEITVLNLRTVCPKIKYNIGDEGGKIPFFQMKDVLEKQGYNFRRLLKSCQIQPLAPLPFLYLFGRSDGTVSVNGANIYSSDVYEAIFSDPDLAAKISTFKLSVEMDSEKSLRLFIYLEAKQGEEITESLEQKSRLNIVSKILASAECFRNAYESNPEAHKPVLTILPFRTGLFKDEGELLKYRYIKK